MKNFTLFMILLLVACTVQAQFKSVQKIITDDFQVLSNNISNLKNKSASNPINCGEDTLEYARYKGTAFQAISISNGYALGQYFDSPDTVSVSGATFYGWSLSTANDSIEITVSLYKAGADTLPTGSAIRTAKIMVDTAFNRGVLTGLRKSVVFNTAYKTTDPFIITIESSDSIRTGIVANSYANKDGEGENISCGTVSGTWYRCLNLNIGGATLDCDMLLEPHVSYTTFADFSALECFNYLDSVSFNNKSTNILKHRMYNRYLAYDLGQYSYYWSFGIGASSLYDTMPKYKFPINKNYTTRLVTTMYTYRAGNSCKDTAYQDLYFQPSEIGFSVDTPICSGNSATINAVSTGLISWYHNDTASLPFNQGYKYETPILDSSIQYILESKNNICSTQRKIVDVTVAQSPSLPITFNDSICLNAKANLVGQTDVGNIIWWSDSIGGTSLDTANVFVSEKLSQSSIYYAEADNRGCKSRSRVKTVANVNANNAPPEPITNLDSTICLFDGNVALSATSTSSTIRWFNHPSDNLPIATGNSYTFFPEKLGAKLIYVEAYDGQCASTQVQKRVMVWTFPSHSFANEDTLCLGDSLALDFSYTYGAVKWYDQAAGGVVLHDSNEFNIKNLSSSETFYLEPYSQGCKDTLRHALEIGVLPFGEINAINEITICEDKSADLDATTTIGEVIWSVNENLEPIVSIGNSYTTEALKANTTYYAASRNYKCISEPLAIIVIVNKAPNAGFNYQVNSKGSFSFLANVAGLNYDWTFGDGSTAKGRSVSHKYKENGDFDVELTTTSNIGCDASNSRTVKVAGLVSTPKITKPNLSIWPNPATDILNISSDAKVRELNITNSLGINVYKQVGYFNNFSLDLNEKRISRGSYIFEIKGDNFKTFKRVLIY